MLGCHISLFFTYPIDTEHHTIILFLVKSSKQVVYQLPNAHYDPVKAQHTYPLDNSVPVAWEEPFILALESSTRDRLNKKRQVAGTYGDPSSKKYPWTGIWQLLEGPFLDNNTAYH